MKNFYLTLASAAVLFSASAATPVAGLNSGRQLINVDPSGKSKAIRNFKNSGQFISHDGTTDTSNLVVTGMRKADAQKTIEGVWTFDFGNYYDKNSQPGVLKKDFVCSIRDGEVFFDDPTGYELPFIGVLDETGTKLTFSDHLLGLMELYYVYQNPFVFNPKNSTNPLEKKPITAVYDAEAGTLVFPADNGIAWCGYVNMEGTDFFGYYGIYDLERAIKISDVVELNEEQLGQWEPMGMATFIDGFIVPGYQEAGKMLNPNDYPFKVELQRHVSKHGLWRLWKPYHQEDYILLENNESQFMGQIQFDISNPDNVLVIANDLPAGFKDNHGEHYLTNEVGYWHNYWGGLLDLDDIAEVVKQQGKELDTFKDGVVTINYPLFDFSAAHEKGYNWNNRYPAIITFSEEAIASVKGLESDIYEGNPRYFNLQGIEVTNPISGNIYIKVEGKNSTKVIF